MKNKKWNSLARGALCASMLFGFAGVSHAQTKAQKPLRVRATTALLAPHPSLPRIGSSEGLGVNIHFTSPRAGEMQMLREGGFRWIRMDFTWSAIERTRGVYDFSAYDVLVRELEKSGTKALFIFDYGNGLYEDNGVAPRSEESRAAFARWAAAGVAHFKGRGILWEMWNEPNFKPFWTPEPNVENYIALARTTGEAIRKAAPGEAFIGPATSTIDFKFLEACFKAGLLEYWDAVSTHPYRGPSPETVIEEYRRLRNLIAKYAPTGKNIPILSGEWGYSTFTGGVKEDVQAKFLARQWLTNLSNDVPLSIWYDWHDDGQDPKDPEHNHGTTRFSYFENREPIYDTKPSYEAARTLTTSLRGFAFNKRLAVGNEDDYVLLFSRENDVRVVAWTTASPHRLTIPASQGTFSVTGHRGEKLPDTVASASGLEAEVSDAPQYFAPAKTNDLLTIAAAWQRAPLEVQVLAPRQVEVKLAFKNPLQSTLKIEKAGGTVALAPGASTVLSSRQSVTRGKARNSLLFSLKLAGAPEFTQRSLLETTNVIGAELAPLPDSTLVLHLENPSGQAFRGRATLTNTSWETRAAPTQIVVLKTGETQKDVLFAAPPEFARREYSLGFELRDEKGSNVLVRETRRFRDAYEHPPRDEFGLQNFFKIVPDSDTKIDATGKLSLQSPPKSIADVSLAGGAVRLDYSFGAGWKYLQIQSQSPEPIPIDGKPRAVAMWIHGDNSDNVFHLRLRDATGQIFQPNGVHITWNGWKSVVVPLDSAHSGSWGGAKDAVIHHPLVWDTLFLLDSNRSANSGTVYFTLPTLIY